MAETLSIIIPAYNEGANIVRVLDKIHRVKLPFGIEKEIILVDDGSVDDTATLSLRLASLLAMMPIFLWARRLRRR